MSRASAPHFSAAIAAFTVFAVELVPAPTIIGTFPPASSITIFAIFSFSSVSSVGVSPVVPRLPHKIGEKISDEEMFQYDALTCPMNLAGNCAISIPCGELQATASPTSTPSRNAGREDSSGVPVGMQIACDEFGDELMLCVARSIEKI